MEKQNTYSFHLALLSEDDTLCDLWLPNDPEGFLHFSDTPEHRFLSIAARDGNWYAICKNPAFFCNVPIENSYDIRIEDGQFLEVECEDKRYLLYSEKVTNKNQKFKNYFINSDISLSIGAQADCDICYSRPYIAQRHAILYRTGNRWAIQCCSVATGLYINGIKQKSSGLNIGDSIYLFGLRIIVGPNYLAINSEMEQVKLGWKLQPNMAQQIGHSYRYEYERTADKEVFFNRLPRKRIRWEPKTITVEGPPMSMSNTQIPMMLRMGSSMVMGGAAALAGNFMSLITSVIFPLLSSKYTDKQRQDYEQLRISKYTEYLDKKHSEIIAACEEELTVLRKKYPDICEVVRTVDEKNRLWERRPIDDDFLHVRLGIGKQQMSSTIDYPTKRFALEADTLEENMYQLVEKTYMLENAPIILSLTDTTVCGLLGTRDRLIAYIQKLVLQIAAYHSYDEVKMVFLLNEADLNQMDNLRYLPHAWDDQRSIRYIATKEAEAYAIGEHIKTQIEGQRNKGNNWREILKARPYYVIFAMDKKLLESHEVMKEILQSDSNQGVSIIAAYNDLPKETQTMLSLVSDRENIRTVLGSNGAEETRFSSDFCDKESIDQAMHTLANTRLKAIAQAQTMPKTVTFLEMFRAGRVEQLNPLKHWRENNPVKSLAAPIGIGEDGTVFMLDLHEKRQGPHGLVAGMTGSGKSEFLITYILSMAVNYHPNEVAFLLIDYKGGGLVDAFENPRTGMRLPHLAGTITNLDGASIQRSLMSIESELVRRQKEFSKVSKSFDEGSMNIYTYQKLYREGKVSEPMPHLFIISDEFAELKQQQPEFMDKLISAARIGRSLGIHLILATQKPSGVVNDQIRSNTKFRVCLRVQERADSQDMLKRPEAAELTDTGRFYLQVGFNEYFALGQSAWCGAAYEPQDAVTVQRDDSVEFLDMTGQVVTKNKPKVKKTCSGMTQIGAVVQYLNDLAESQNIQPCSLWVEPLPAEIEYANLVAEYGEPAEGITAMIGLADDPVRQTQLPLCLDLMSFHHMALVGLAGSGKSNLFKTMLYSLVNKYTPEDVNFYILDLSSGVLSAFKNMPHCGAYLTKENEPDFDRLLALVQDIVDERKKLFADADVYSYDDYLNIRKLPLVLVILDGWTNIHDFAKGQQYSLGISKHMRDAANYGVRFLFSANHLNEFSSKVNQEFDYKIALQAKDKFEYNDILSLRNAIVPQEVPGRGLCDMGGRALEYQVAAPYCKLDGQEQVVRMREDLQDRADQLRDYKAAKCLPVVDDKLEYANFCVSFATDRIPLGFSMQTMQPIAMPLQQLHTMSMYFGNPIGVKSVIFNILSAFHREKAEVIILRRASGTVFDRNGEEKLQTMYGDRCSVWDTTVENVPKLFDLLVTEYIPKHRVPYRNEYCELHGIPATDKGRTVKAAKYIRSKTTPLLVLFESFPDFAAADKDAVFADVFGMLRGFNIYFVGCFYPEDESVSANRVFRSFGKDDFALLFGGQFHKQWITSILPEYKRMEKVNSNYNRFIMKYRSECYRMVMPCGKLISTDVDPDEKEII